MDRGFRTERGDEARRTKRVSTRVFENQRRARATWWGNGEGTGRDAGRGERRPAANGARASGHRASDARVKHSRSRHSHGVVSYLAVQHRVRAVEQVRHDAHPATNDRRRARLARSVRARTPPRRPGASRLRTRDTRRVIRTLSRNDTDQRSALGCDALAARAHRHRRGKGEGQTAAQGKSPYEHHDSSPVRPATHVKISSRKDSLAEWHSRREKAKAQECFPFRLSKRCLGTRALDWDKERRAVRFRRRRPGVMPIPPVDTLVKYESPIMVRLRSLRAPNRTPPAFSPRTTSRRVPVPSAALARRVRL